MKVVMIDQDGVVCNKQYRTTANIKPFIRLIKDKILLVPNSDTPVERIVRNFSEMVDFLSLIIIGEKGAVVRFRDDYFFSKDVKGIEEYREKIVSLFALKGAEVEIGDSATWVKNGKRFKPNSRMVIIDGLRQQSIGFYLRTTDKRGLPQIDGKWASEGINLIKDIELPRGLDEFDYNPDYGIAISNARDVTKTTGYLLLKEKLPDSQFFMVGDGIIDIIDDDSVIHCAVSNAVPLLKDKSSFISSSPFTQGLKECLEWILEE